MIRLNSSQDIFPLSLIFTGVGQKSQMLPNFTLLWSMVFELSNRPKIYNILDNYDVWPISHPDTVKLGPPTPRSSQRHIRGWALGGA